MELYIHIPFCVRKCLYCDFLSFPCQGLDTGAYCRALVRELAFHREGGGLKDLKTIFIGGGTPSLLGLKETELLLSAISQATAVEEFTIECNPGTLTADKLRLYREYGVNRLSLGLQSTFDGELKRLGRIHDYETFLRSYDLVREAGFDNVNIDLMSAIPGQTLKTWEEGLRRIVELGPEHISAYSLIIEPDTPFEVMEARGELDLVDEEDERLMYHITADILAAGGYGRYEISNYARPGRECRHNLGYWTGEPYIGIGLGAASYLADKGSDRFLRIKNTENLAAYTADPLKGSLVEELLEPEDRMAEYVILHLRLTRGFELKEFADRFACDFMDRFGHISRKYLSNGLLKLEEGRVFLSEKGLDLSNIVMEEFI